jgi:hypothetical protein
MGNFYANITLRTTDTARVDTTLRAMQRTAFVSQPTTQFLVIFDREIEGGEPSELFSLAAALSQRLQCAAFPVYNLDDSELLFALLDGGELIAEYSSDTDAAGPVSLREARELSTELVRVLSPPDDNITRVAALLTTSDSGNEGTFTFEIERHQALVEALALPVISVGAGYEYLAMGEFPDGFSKSDVRRIDPG